MYNDIPTTCFGRFLTGHHQVGIQCQKNYIPTISIDIIISVSTEKSGRTRSRLQIQGVWLDRLLHLQWCRQWLLWLPTNNSCSSE